MLAQLYDKLKNTHNEEFQFIKEKKLFDAFVILKSKNDYGSKLLISAIYIIMNKNKDAILKLKELENDKDFLKENLIAEDILYEMIGTCFFSMKNYLDAAAYYIKALDVKNDNFYCIYNLASIHILSKDYKKALEFLEKIREIEPKNEIINKNIENLKIKLQKEKTD